MVGDKVQEVMGQQEPVFAKPIIQVNVIRDAHQCEIILKKPQPNTAPPLLDDLQKALADKGVTYGIFNDILHSLTLDPIFDRPLVVAQGKLPTVGKEGSLRFLISTERELRPTILPDGTADYKKLGYVNNVEKGQPLCEIIPPEKGEDGINVYGQVLEGIYGKAAPSPQGAGTEITPDGKLLVAAVAGNAVVSKNVVTVQEVLKIKGNVDNSTGDIYFVGDVQVDGDVVSGFTISGTNLIIRGNVEGATLIAAGDVTLAQGMNGMNRGTITATGNVRAKYLQNCTVKAEGDIYADYIMYSHLECDGNVELSGKRAALIGGRSYIAGRLIAKTIGTEAHTATEINMAISGMSIKHKVEQLTADIQNIDGEILKLVQNLNRLDSLRKQNRLTQKHVAIIRQIKERYVALNNDRKKLVENLEEIKQRQLRQSSLNSYIECKGKVHAGVRIAFGPLIYNVQDSFVNSRIGIVDGDIKISSL